MSLSIVQTSAGYLAKGLSYYTLSTGLIAASVAVWQEYKIWAPHSVPTLSLWGCTKVFLYNTVWMSTCLVGTGLLLLKWILTAGRTNLEHECNLYLENMVARLCTTLFVGKVSINGSLPASDMVPAPVYVANHASQIDVSLPYYFHRRFKWISKRSVYYLPGVGGVVYLGNHVTIDRRTGQNKGSVSNLYEKSTEAVQSGIPMFIFPQGTRRMAEKLPFKKGAFVVAQTSKSPLIPVSIDIPGNPWNNLYPISLLWGGKAPTIKVTVHEPVPASDDLERIKQQCMDRIYSVLPEIGASDRKNQ